MSTTYELALHPAAQDLLFHEARTANAFTVCRRSSRTTITRR
ncbi:hypothetical protein ACFV9E_14420 [Streptomyces sp. NPDC059835]